MKVSIKILEKEIMPLIHEVLDVMNDLTLKLNISKQLQSWEAATQKIKTIAIENLIKNDVRFHRDPKELVGVARTNLKKIAMSEINKTIRKSEVELELSLAPIFPYLEKFSIESQNIYNKYFHNEENESCN